MLKRVTGILCTLCIFFSMVQGVDKSGYITADETWSGEIIITGNVTITSGVVTISPGTVIKHLNTTAHIIIRRDGGMKAIGTEESHITFTTASSSPAKGSWDEIDIMNLTNSANTVFRYCDFIWGKTVIDIRNESGRTEKSAPTFEYCTFTHCYATGIYITSGGSPTIRYCVFRDLSSGVYLHGADLVSISYCEISVASAGIINVGLDPWYQKCTIDHCTVYDLKNIRTDYVRLHTGYCFYTGDDTGQLTVTNSICQNIQNSGTTEGTGWTLNNDYNAFYDILITEVYDGEMGPHSMAADPLMTDPESGDFRLQDTSPCIGAASDGTNIGSSQEVTTGIAEPSVPRAAAGRIRCHPDPFTTTTDIRLPVDARSAEVFIFQPDGALVRRLVPAAPAAIVRWDGTDFYGNQVLPGIYCVVVQNGPETFRETVLYANP